MENFGRKIQLKFYMRIIEIPGWYTYSVQLSIEIPGSGFPSLYQRYTYRVDAVGSSQIFFPTQNLARAYQVDKESKAVLSYFQYDQCAGPQKQEVIYGHNSTISWQKIKVRNVFQ